MRGSARQAAIASGVNQIVRLPRARRPASFSAQLVTRCRCFGMWRRHAALALNGTAGIQASGKGPSSYTAQLPTPTGRSVQQGGTNAAQGDNILIFTLGCIKGILRPYYAGKNLLSQNGSFSKTALTEFRCSAPQREGKSPQNARESGECR